METTALEGAYEGWLAAVELGPATRPPRDGGWPAEWVLAHVTLNDRLIAAHLAEAISGGSPSYDNHPVTRPVAFEALIRACGGWDGLAAEAQRTSQEVLTLAGGLNEEIAALPFPTYILDGDTVQVDQPLPLAAFV